MKRPSSSIIAPKALPGRAFALPASLPPGSLLTPAHLTHLEMYGFAIVENVMSAAQCATVKQQWLATMASYEGTQLDPANRATWTTANLPASTRGMADWPPVAQEAWAWETRFVTAPVYAALWGCAEADLISSMDRVCFVPHERLRMNKANQAGWMHMDQARVARRGTLECVQGFVTLNDIGAGEVALQVLEGAHKYHRQFFDEHLAVVDPERLSKCQNADWHKFDKDEGRDHAWYLAQPGVREVRVHAPAGSMVLWDSRVPHHAMPPKDNAHRSQIDRFVIYSCMVPRAWATQENMKKRIKAFETGRATSHWPQDGKAFPKKPRTYGKDTVLLDPNDDPVEKQVALLPTRVSNYALLRRLVGYHQ
jgi:ectoine hydroxylase-related dioxygenase (phytanoyl-CoA dioxygenase family)